MVPEELAGFHLLEHPEDRTSHCLEQEGCCCSAEGGAATGY